MCPVCWIENAYQTGLFLIDTKILAIIYKCLCIPSKAYQRIGRNF
jgi:hypothetical protein